MTGHSPEQLALGDSTLSKGIGVVNVQRCLGTSRILIL